MASLTASRSPMHNLSSASRSFSPSQQSQFLRSWNPPDSESEFTTKVQALAKVFSLDKTKVKYIADFYKYRTGVDISNAEFLDEYDMYISGEWTFPANLEENMSTDGQTESDADHHSSEDHAGFDSGNFGDEDSIDGKTTGGQDVVDGQATGGHDVVDGVDEPDGASLSCVSAPGHHRSSKGGRKRSVPGKSSLPSLSSGSQLPGDAATRIDSGVGFDSLGSSDIETDSVPEVPNPSKSVRTNESEVSKEPEKSEYAKVTVMSTVEKERWLLQNILLALQREHDILDMARKCHECKTNPRDITFLPCGHFTMCKLCSEPIYECPSCHKDILATAQTFLS